MTDLGLDDIATGSGPEALRRLTIPAFGHAWEFIVDHRRTWFVPVMGTAVMAQYLHAACLMGARRLLLVGTVGGLSPDLHPADFIVPTVSRGTHSAWMYSRTEPPDSQPDRRFSEVLVGRLEAALPPGTNVAQGPTTTCECIAAETWDDVRPGRREHCFVIMQKVPATRRT